MQSNISSLLLFQHKSLDFQSFLVTFFNLKNCRKNIFKRKGKQPLGDDLKFLIPVQSSRALIDSSNQTMEPDLPALTVTTTANNGESVFVLFGFRRGPRMKSGATTASFNLSALTAVNIARNERLPCTTKYGTAAVRLAGPTSFCRPFHRSFGFHRKEERMKRVS